MNLFLLIKMFINKNDYITHEQNNKDISIMMCSIQENIIDYINNNTDKVTFGEIVFNGDYRVFDKYININEIVYRTLLTLSHLSKYFTTKNNEQITERIISYLSDIYEYIEHIIEKSNNKIYKILELHDQTIDTGVFDKLEIIEKLYDYDEFFNDDLFRDDSYHGSPHEFMEDFYDLDEIGDWDRKRDQVTWYLKGGVEKDKSSFTLENYSLTIEDLIKYVDKGLINSLVEALEENKNIYKGIDRDIINRCDIEIDTKEDMKKYNSDYNEYEDEFNDEYSEIDYFKMYDVDFYCCEGFNRYFHCNSRNAYLTTKKCLVLYWYELCKKYHVDNEMDVLNLYRTFNEYFVSDEVIQCLFKHNDKIIDFFDVDKDKKNIIEENLLVDIIRNDDINKFQEYISLNNIPLNETIYSNQINNFYPLLYSDIKYDLLSLSVYYGSIKIFKYIMLNNTEKIINHTKIIQLAIQSRNYEILHILVNELKVELNDITYLRVAILTYDEKMFYYILNNYNHSEFIKIYNEIYGISNNYIFDEKLKKHYEDIIEEVLTKLDNE